MPEEEAPSPGAPFIPADADAPPVPPSPWRVFDSRPFLRLWIAQVVSSLGDWIGLIAILAIAARVSNNSGAAVSLVMVTRVVPGFFLGTVGGVIIDRFDRRKVMVLCDAGRASVLLLLPFVESLLGLVLVSLALEVLTLLWGAAQAATVPNLVAEDQLQSANSLSLAASYGTFPIASIIFSLLAGLAAVLGDLDVISSFKVDQEFLALAVRRVHVPRLRGDRVPIADPAHRAQRRRQADRLDRDDPRRQGGAAVRRAASARARRDARPRDRPHRRRAR